MTTRHRWVNTILWTFLLSLTGTAAVANIIRVPEDQPTIQAGIETATDGDTVLVSPGTYFENIDFGGKKIVVASHYILDRDPSTITGTIIDGSQPIQPDTASCVLFVSGEDSSSILEGFTLTGGTGTRWIDEHGAGTYFEGGGILITLSSPTIRNNVIIGNEAIRRPPGVASAGGGGIRCGDGSPLIVNNVITGNSGMYGGGIVMNYASGIIRNNIITNNDVYQAVPGAGTFGGGGIWVFGSGTTTRIENNTIIGNSSDGPGGAAAGRGGGLLVWLTPVDARNNIIRGNTQRAGGQIFVLQTPTSITYNNVEGGWTGEGNIDEIALFGPEDYYLQEGSPCIDAGDSSIAFNDPEDPMNPGMALWPSLGGLRNDMGTYGGPLRQDLGFNPTGVGGEPDVTVPKGFSLAQNHPNPFNPSTTIRYTLSRPSPVILRIFDLRGRIVRTFQNGQQGSGSYAIHWDSTVSRPDRNRTRRRCCSGNNRRRRSEHALPRCVRSAMRMDGRPCSFNRTRSTRSSAASHRHRGSSRRPYRRRSRPRCSG
jgi:hypothetical protein